MFGVEATGDESRTRFRVCCGPRCGAEPGHRAVYAAAERAAANRDADIIPTMCQGFCGLGVTLALPDGTRIKLRDAREARVQIETQIENWRIEEPCQP